MEDAVAHTCAPIWEPGPSWLVVIYTSPPISDAARCHACPSQNLTSISTHTQGRGAVANTSGGVVKCPNDGRGEGDFSSSEKAEGLVFIYCLEWSFRWGLEKICQVVSTEWRGLLGKERGVKADDESLLSYCRL